MSKINVNSLFIVLLVILIGVAGYFAFRINKITGVFTNNSVENTAKNFGPIKDDIPVVPDVEYGFHLSDNQEGYNFPGGIQVYDLTGKLDSVPATDDSGALVVPLLLNSNIRISLRVLPLDFGDGVKRVPVTKNTQETNSEGKLVIRKTTTNEDISSAISFYKEKVGNPFTVKVLYSENANDITSYLESALEKENCNQNCKDRTQILISETPQTQQILGSLFSTQTEGGTVTPVITNIYEAE